MSPQNIKKQIFLVGEEEEGDIDEAGDVSWYVPLDKRLKKKINV